MPRVLIPHQIKFSIANIIAFIMKKIKNIFSIFLYLIILILLSANYDNADRISYEHNYLEIQSGYYDINFEPGYQALAFLFSKIGFSFELFNFIIFTFGFSLIYITILQYSKRPNIILIMYASYPLFWDYIQVRNFLSSAILIYGIRFIIDINKENKKNFIISIIVASLFHVSAIIYLSFLITWQKNKLSFFLLLAFLLVSITTIPYLTIVVDHIGLSARLNHYITTETSLLTKISVTMLFILTIFLIQISTKNSTLIKSSSNCHIAINMFFVRRIFWISIIFLPLALNNLDFLRLHRNLFVLTSIILVSGICLHKQILTRSLFVISIVIYTLTSFYGFVYLVSESDIINNIYTKNYIIDLLSIK